MQPPGLGSRFSARGFDGLAVGSPPLGIGEAESAYQVEGEALLGEGSSHLSAESGGERRRQ